ncbi:MAG: STY0301 family protein [Burkholderiaceae bacterium]
MRAPLTAAAGLASCIAVHAAATTDACPRELNVKQAVSAEIAGWTPLNQQDDYPFARIAIYRGPPAGSTRLVPTSEIRNATGLHDTWRLPKDPAGYWVQCQYGNTTAVVARKLDDDADFCLADYDPRFTTLVVKHWSCLPWQPSKTVPPQKPAVQPAAAPKEGLHWVHGPP